MARSPRGSCDAVSDREWASEARRPSTDVTGQGRAFQSSRIRDFRQHSRIRWKEMPEGATDQLGTVTEPSGSMREDLFPIQERLVRLPAQPRERDRFMVLQKWEGTVSRVTETEFAATLHDLSDPS